MPGVEPSTPLDSGAWVAGLSAAAHRVVAEDRPEGGRSIRPAGEGPFPAILVASGSTDALEADRRAYELARRGYACERAGATDAGALLAALAALAGRPWVGNRIGLLAEGDAARAAFAASASAPRLAALATITPADGDEPAAVPALHVTGWFDAGLESTLERFARARNREPTIESSLSQYLVVGPWAGGPGFDRSRRKGGLDLGPQAVVELDLLLVRFFDRWLRGVDNGLDTEARARVFVLGRNEWVDLPDWPAPGVRYTSVDAGGGTLPVETASRPLSSPLELLGPAEVAIRLDAASAGELTATIHRQSADGRRVLLSSAARIVHRRPGEVVLQARPIGARLEVGDRIVVRIESTDPAGTIAGGRAILPVLPSPEAPGLQLARAA